MANRLFYSFRRASLTSLFKFSPSNSPPFGSFVHLSQSILYRSQDFLYLSLWRPSWVFRNLSHGSVNLVISHGKPKFETHEIEPPKKDKWKTKKRLKLQRKREKQKRKSANKRDPRLLGVKGKKKKQKFPNAEARIRDKIEKAKIKEALLIERLKRYEVPKLQGPEIEPDNLTGEERFYMKKMAQKRSNYVPVGRRGVFGGVILNMHLHWKKHETVKVICKPCKPGQVRDYANEIARLSGGIPIQIIGNDTIIFYRGKNYFQPKVMSPIDTLSKKRALEKSKYEQSLESVRRFIAIAEKELELYYRHVALYGDPNNRDSISTLTDSGRGSGELRESKTIEGEYHELRSDGSFSTYFSEGEEDFTGGEISENGHEEDEDFEGSEVDFEDDDLTSTDSNYRESSFTVEEMPLSYLGSSLKGHTWVSNNQDLVSRRFQTDEN